MSSWKHPINPCRFSALLARVGGNHWHAHVLDRLIYRCQQSTLQYEGKQAFTEPLAQLAAFIGASSIRSLQYALTALEAHSLIGRTGTFTDYGSQCMLWLTEDCWSQLTQQISNESANNSGVPLVANVSAYRAPNGPYQAETIYRYAAMTALFDTPATGAAGFMQHYVLNYVMYRTQVDAKQQGVAPETLATRLSLETSSQQLSMSARSLQRYLRELEAQGLLIKSRQKISACRVATAYQVAGRVWAAMEHAHTEPYRAAVRAQTLPASQTPFVHRLPAAGATACAANDASSPAANTAHNMVNLGENRLKLRQCQEGEEFGVSKDEEFGVSNKNIEIKNIAINHSTASSAQVESVTRETCQNNGQPSIVNLKQVSKRGEGDRGDLNTVLDGNTPLNRRQMRYLRGMLAKLQQQHGYQFSNPHGLLEEITFAVQQIHTIFVGRHRFCHRVNLIAKLLRERRWTTPHGYERYDAKGQAQKARREARAAAWAAEKAEQASPPPERPAIRPTGAAVLGRLLPRLGAPPPPSSSPSVPPEIAERLAMMKRLAERAKAPDCSEAARAGITALLQQHQAAIQAAMAKTAVCEGGDTC